MRKSTIIKDIVEALADALPQLKYVDKDWGQLNLEQPAVGWPCALADIEAVEYSDLGCGWQLASATIEVTVANKRTTSSSAHAPGDSKERSYLTLELCDAIHLRLQGFNGGHTPSLYAPLSRTSFFKNTDGLGYECYTMRYKTQFKVPSTTVATHEVASVGVVVGMGSMPGQGQ